MPNPNLSFTVFQNSVRVAKFVSDREACLYARQLSVRDAGLTTEVVYRGSGNTKRGGGLVGQYFRGEVLPEFASHEHARAA